MFCILYPAVTQCNYSSEKENGGCGDEKVELKVGKGRWKLARDHVIGFKGPSKYGNDGDAPE